MLTLSTSEATVTLKTLAKEAGLSASAVSQILNNKPNDFSSEETKQRVREIARKLGYRQSFRHRLLRKEKTRTVGLIIASPISQEEEHIQHLILRIIGDFNNNGYVAYLQVMHRDEQTNLGLIQELVDRGVAHFVFIGTPFGHKDIEEYILSKNLTLIGWSSLFSRNLNSDPASGVEELIRHYISKGLSNFRFLVRENCPHVIESLQRVYPDLPRDELCRKYIAGLDKLNWDAENFQDTSTKLGYEATHRALEEDGSIQVLFYLSDIFAIGGAKYLHEHNFIIGKDICVAGFNNIYAVRNNVFPISSIEHDIEKISKLLLQEAFENGPFQEVVKTKVFVRD